jgi:predicted enzyme related to lactoylglutathione lyase
VPERDGHIPGVPSFADTSQPDPDAAADFYGGLFGWELENVLPADSPGKYLVGRIRGGDVGAIGSIEEGEPPTAMWRTYVWVESADETAAKVWKAGGRVITEPIDVMPDAGRTAVFADPEGAVFRVWQAYENKGWQIVNEPGSVTMTTLNTRNADAAKRFYNSVFGWDTLRLEDGVEMWTLAGYGDYLEREDPHQRKRLAEGGAPEGFEDVVGRINPIPGDQPDVPAHWSVTFAVDDAHATAKKAADLGGRVIAPPFDARWLRITVIEDPQGATFAASQYVPENKDLGTTSGADGGAS